MKKKAEEKLELCKTYENVLHKGNDFGLRDPKLPTAKISKKVKTDKNKKDEKVKIPPSTMISRRVCIATASLIAKNILLINKAFSTLTENKE